MPELQVISLSPTLVIATDASGQAMIHSVQEMIRDHFFACGQTENAFQQIFRYMRLVSPETAVSLSPTPKQTQAKSLAEMVRQAWDIAFETVPPVEPDGEGSTIVRFQYDVPQIILVGSADTDELYTLTRALQAETNGLPGELVSMFLIAVSTAQRRSRASDTLQDLPLLQQPWLEGDDMLPLITLFEADAGEHRLNEEALIYYAAQTLFALLVTTLDRSTRFEQFQRNIKEARYQGRLLITSLVAQHYVFPRAAILENAASRLALDLLRSELHPHLHTIEQHDRMVQDTYVEEQVANIFEIVNHAVALNDTLEKKGAQAFTDRQGFSTPLLTQTSVRLQKDAEALADALNPPEYADEQILDAMIMQRLQEEAQGKTWRVHCEEAWREQTTLMHQQIHNAITFLFRSDESLSFARVDRFITLLQRQLTAPAASQYCAIETTYRHDLTEWQKARTNALKPEALFQGQQSGANPQRWNGLGNLFANTPLGRWLIRNVMQRVVLVSLLVGILGILNVYLRWVTNGLALILGFFHVQLAPIIPLQFQSFITVSANIVSTLGGIYTFLWYLGQLWNRKQNRDNFLGAERVCSELEHFEEQQVRQYFLQLETLLHEEKRRFHTNISELLAEIEHDSRQRALQRHHQEHLVGPYQMTRHRRWEHLARETYRLVQRNAFADLRQRFHDALTYEWDYQDPYQLVDLLKHRLPAIAFSIALAVCNEATIGNTTFDLITLEKRDLHRLQGMFATAKPSINARRWRAPFSEFHLVALPARLTQYRAGFMHGAQESCNLVPSNIIMVISGYAGALPLTHHHSLLEKGAY